MSKQSKMKRMSFLINDILVEKAEELKQEVYRQLRDMPLKKRLVFAWKVLLKKI